MLRHSNLKLKNAVEFEINRNVLKIKEIELRIENSNQKESTKKSTISFVEKIANDYHAIVAISKDISMLLKEQVCASDKLQQLENKILTEQKRQKCFENQDALGVKHYNLYKTNLGFSITTATGHDDEKCLNFAFYNISKKNPQKRFSFNLNTDGVSYTVSDCVPQISEMDGLLKELNQTNDLRYFILALRRKFCDIAESNSSGD